MTSRRLRAVAFAVLALTARHANAEVAGPLASARSLRCTFQLSVAGTWTSDGAAETALKTPKLILLFESIDTDEGTAKMRNGTMLSDIVARLAGGYLHFMQSFRSGPLYTTTVFDKETSQGKFKAVHSRHEYFTIPVPGATSSPEQYYGECEIRP